MCAQRCAPTVEVLETLARLQCVNVPPTAADFLIARNPLEVTSELVQWHIALIGAWVLQPGILIGQRGISVKYKIALRTRRKVWCSQAFQLLLRELLAIHPSPSSSL